MITANDRIAKTSEKMQQLDRQRILRENREKEATRTVNLRRQIIVGTLFIKHFPVVLNFTPRRTTQENHIEFAPLEDFLTVLSENPKYQQLDHSG